MSVAGKLGELLIEAGVLTREQLSEALARQRTNGGRLGTNLVELGFVDEKTVASVLARRTIPSATAAQLDKAASTATKLLSANDADRLRAVPLREDAGKLWVAMANPTDQAALSELEKLTRRPIRAMVAPELLLQYGLEKHYGVKKKVRVVQVQAGGADLTKIGGGRGAPPPPPDAGSSAPVWDPYAVSAKAKVNVDAVAAYIDQQDDDGISLPTPTVARTTLKELAQELIKATTDDAVFEQGMRFVNQDAPRVVAFVLRGEQLSGWHALGIDGNLVRKLVVALGDLAHLAQALSTGEAFVGKLPARELGPLAGPLDIGWETVAVVVPVRIGKRAVGVILGVDAAPSAVKTKAELDKVAQKLDQALHIGYLRRLLLQ